MAWDTGDGMGWWMLFGGFFSIVFWGAIIYLVVALTRRPRSDRHEGREEPIDILKRRYASGDLSSDEYERMRRDLAA